MFPKGSSTSQRSSACLEGVQHKLSMSPKGSAHLEGVQHISKGFRTSPKGFSISPKGFSTFPGDSAHLEEVHHISKGLGHFPGRCRQHQHLGGLKLGGRPDPLPPHGLGEGRAPRVKCQPPNSGACCFLGHYPRAHPRDKEPVPALSPPLSSAMGQTHPRGHNRILGSNPGTSPKPSWTWLCWSRRF